MNLCPLHSALLSQSFYAVVKVHGPVNPNYLIYVFRLSPFFFIINFLCFKSATYVGTADGNFQLFVKMPFDYCLFLNFL